jgi:glycine/D-amino acid oxidase-like deaminating enzyme
VNFRYDGEAFFNERIWPALYERSSSFESLKHLTGWAGQYEISPDDSAIIGEVELGAARGTGRVFEAHSFSGHGAMHSPAAGLLLAERMMLGKYETLDISAMSGSRFDKGQLVQESAVI